MFARWEWIIIELVVLALLVWELVRTRRSIRADRMKAKADDAAGKG
jgi:lipopolysaccharide export system protein LptC